MKARRTLGFSAACILLLTVVLSAPRTALCSPTCPPDWNNNGVVEVQDIFDFLNDWFAGCTGPLPNAPPCFGAADFNLSGAITVQDIFDFINAWFAGCPSIVGLSISPTHGTLGTQITLSVPNAPTTATFANTQTIITWSGRYSPTTGTSSAVFEYSWASGQYSVVDDHTVTIAFGSGTPVVLPSSYSVASGTGQFQGTLSVAFSDGTSAASVVSFAPDFTTVRWCPLHYDAPYSSDPSGYLPTIGPAAASIRVFRLSLLPDPVYVTGAQIAAATGSHYLAKVLVARNTDSSAQAPSTITVDVFTTNSVGTPFDGISGLQFYRDDSDPDLDNIVYRSSRRSPFIFIDLWFDPDDYPDWYVQAQFNYMLLITCPVNGKVIVAPHVE